MNQNRTPLFTALKNYAMKDTVQFDVPGHKQGLGNKELTEFFGINTMACDLNSMKPLDNIANPLGIIKEAEELLAEAYGCDYGFFLVNGTTQGVQAMIMTACRPGDKIIVQRNVHKSAIKAMILCGAIPVYLKPNINKELGITTSISIEELKNTIKDNPDAKAVFINNPTYYGFATDLRAVIDIVHDNNMMVLCDEAHGAHMRFNKNLPPSSMEIGGDMAAVSIHKTAGSLSQSSALLINEGRVNKDRVKTILNLTQTTSASYLLMSSLDVARKQLAMFGHEMLEETIELAKYARDKINNIFGYYAFGKELIDNVAVYDFDQTKLGIKVSDLGLNGFEVYNILRDKYDIQVEFGDVNNILAIITIGDTKEAVDKLINALEDIAIKYRCDKEIKSYVDLIEHNVVESPRNAFYSDKESVKLEDSVGRICGEHIMVYPPGIPIVTPGEVITEEMKDYIEFLKKQDTSMTGTEDPLIDNIKVLVK